MKKKFLRTIAYSLAALTGILTLTAMPMEDIHCTKDMPLMGSVENKKSDYSDWELKIMENNGWYTDSKTGGNRFAGQLARAHRRMLDGSKIGQDYHDNLYCNAEAHLAMLRANTLSEKDLLTYMKAGDYDVYAKRNCVTGETFEADLAHKSKAVKIFLTNGYMTEYLDELKNLKLIEDDYSVPKTVKAKNVKKKENCDVISVEKDLELRKLAAAYGY